MKQTPTKSELQAECRSLRQFITDEHLIAWLWPWDHARIVRQIQEYDKAWYARNKGRILPPLPIGKVEQYRAAIESQLLV